MNYDHLEEIRNEIQKAKIKHPEKLEDIIHIVSVVGEESGEALRAALMYHYENGYLSDVREELIQTAATCFRALERIEEYPDKRNSPSGVAGG